MNGFPAAATQTARIPNGLPVANGPVPGASGMMQPVRPNGTQPMQLNAAAANNRLAEMQIRRNYQNMFFAELQRRYPDLALAYKQSNMTAENANQLKVMYTEWLRQQQTISRQQAQNNQYLINQRIAAQSNGNPNGTQGTGPQPQGATGPSQFALRVPTPQAPSSTTNPQDTLSTAASLPNGARPPLMLNSNGIAPLPGPPAPVAGVKRKSPPPSSAPSQGVHIPPGPPANASFQPPRPSSQPQQPNFPGSSNPPSNPNIPPLPSQTQPQAQSSSQGSQITPTQSQSQSQTLVQTQASQSTNSTTVGTPSRTGAQPAGATLAPRIDPSAPPNPSTNGNASGSTPTGEASTSTLATIKNSSSTSPSHEIPMHAWPNPWGPRPTLSGGLGGASLILSTPAHLAFPQIDAESLEAALLPPVTQSSAAANAAAEAARKESLSGSSSLSGKKSVKEIVASIDPRVRVEPEVEDYMLELADEFIDSAINFACMIAKHRGSDTLDVKDLQLHLESNLNIRIPGFASDETRVSISQSAPVGDVLLGVIGIKPSGPGAGTAGAGGAKKEKVPGAPKTGKGKGKKDKDKNGLDPNKDVDGLGRGLRAARLAAIRAMKK